MNKDELLSRIDSCIASVPMPTKLREDILEAIWIVLCDSMPEDGSDDED